MALFEDLAMSRGSPDRSEAPRDIRTAAARNESLYVLILMVVFAPRDRNAVRRPNGPTNQLRAATACHEATRRGSCRA
jgi:hypothetical protein